MTAIASVALALAVTACGSSSSSSSTSSTSATSGGTITEVFGTAPDSLDPGMAYTTQALEPDQVVYTTLLVYQHVAGTAGGTLIPGLVTALPTISSDGKTYTMTLRSGLKFSNGTPVKASNFTYAVERALKIPWGGASFITANVVGANAYATGKAKTISGITTDDSTGQITIKLVNPYGAFSNVLAFPSFAPVPTGTPFKNEPANPPPGVGPYKFANIVPNVSYSVVRNPDWTPIPGIPSGSVNQINVKISSNTTANALSVLNNSADIFDFADTVPPGVLPQVQSQATDRYSKIVAASTYYFFLNTKTKPFSSQLAREAVVYGLDRNAIARLGSGYFIPGCYLLPPTMVGHATQTCPYGDPAVPNLAKAKALVQQSGMAGTPVTVWGEERSPRRQFIDYYTSFLNQIGFKATEKIIADASYFPTIGNLKLNPQTGFADWNQDFPNPIDFYGILAAGDAISPTNNQNFGQINDPNINSKVNSLGTLYKVPSSQLSATASQWQQLDFYAAQKAYFGVFGYASFPKFTSNRIDYGAAVLHQVYGWDWLTLKVK
ncbi:MAG TPA: ABC transporter substrate-binding protein [Solirubrobacteraceae bacterium]|nr:ABC transporter substrate-binding protein [Solirubrobacteraceae bacterium]